VATSTTQSGASTAKALQQNVDLFGDDPPARPATGPPLGTQPPAKSVVAPPKQSKPAQSLLGLDFFGAAPSKPARSTSELGNAPQQASKSDLKQSILSLYASAPKTAPQPQVQSPSAFGGMQSPGSSGSQPQSAGFGGFGGMTDAFSSLKVKSTSPAPPAQTSAFSNLTSSYNNPKSTMTAKPLVNSGGSFFDAAPAPTQRNITPAAQSSGGFGDLFSSSTPATQSKPTATTSNDLFDLSAPTPPRNAAPTQPSLTTTASNTTNPMINLSSAFNLSSISQTPQTIAKPAASTTASFNSGMDAWGSSDVWAAPESNTGNTTASQPNTTSSSGFGGEAGWGSASPVVPKTVKPSQTTIAGDEDFGGWNSAPTAQSSTTTSQTISKPPGGGGGFAAPANDDVFGNVWG